MGHILIVSSSYDKTVDYLMNKYSHLNLIRLNLNEFEKYEISITNNYVKYSSEDFCTNDLFKEINSIYFRKIFLPTLEDYEEQYHNYMLKEIYGFITGMVDSYDGIVLSRPSTLRLSENKIFQLVLAEKLGFKIPKSIISNSKHFVNNNIHHNKWVAKPLSTGKITQKETILTNTICNDVQNIELSPTYFQEKITKDYELRITVIDGHFFCAKIKSNKIDWRNDDKALYETVDTPEIVKNQCIAFMNNLNINFGAFDYIVRNGEYYFLECNPNGQWLWLEILLGFNISEKIMEYLNDGNI